MAVYLVGRADRSNKSVLAPDVPLPTSTRLVVQPSYAEAATAVTGPNYTAGEITAGEGGAAMPAKSHTAGAAVRLAQDLVVTFSDGSNTFLQRGDIIYRPAAVTLGLIS